MAHCFSVFMAFFVQYFSILNVILIQGIADLATSCADKRAFGACLHGISEALGGRISADFPVLSIASPISRMR